MSTSAAAKYDVIGIGNAIVDILARVDERFLLDANLQKGTMALVEEGRSDELRALIVPDAIMSGGSAANTMVGLARFGARAAFIGKVRRDGPGDNFTDDLRKAGVAFTTAASTDGIGTAVCLVFVTPDGERTMSTFLGACRDLDPADIDEAEIAAAKILYLEGYLWDPPFAKDAFRKAVGVARRANRKVALSLSDAFCVDRYRDEFLSLMRDGSLDYVFCNESELHSLYQTADFDTALRALAAEKVTGIVTRSAQGCVVTAPGLAPEAVPARPVENVVDTTGAGDLFAAGFLAGLTRGETMSRCAQLGALGASEIIQQLGARPARDLKRLAEAIA
jgi:sugar/nucleoside kinase (ribokinase family)